MSDSLPSYRKCRVVITVALTGGVLMGLAGCGNKPAAPAGPPVLARVGSQVITTDDFKREVEHRIARRQPVPEKEALLQQMVDRQSMIVRARAARLDADPEVQKEIDNLLISKLRERELDERIRAAEVTDAQVQNEYDSNPSQWTKPAKVRLALLQMRVDPKMSAGKRSEARARLDEAILKLRDNPPAGGRGPAAGGFGAVAIDYSEDQVSRYRGGDIGWLDAGQFAYRWPRSVLEAGYKLEKGGVSGVIEAEDGFYVVMKTDFQSGATTPLAEAQTSLRQSLLVKKRRRIEEEFRVESGRAAKAEIDHKALKAFEMPAGPAIAQKNSESAPPALPGMNPSSHGH